MCKPPMTFNNGWKYTCLDCDGKGYEEKLSCGCTGYEMRRPCKPCNTMGTVNLLTHDIQVNEHNKQREKIYGRYPEGD